jgi:hypothetical protein
LQVLTTKVCSPAGVNPTAGCTLFCVNGRYE